jgi:hypothetical protein
MLTLFIALFLIVVTGAPIIFGSFQSEANASANATYWATHNMSDNNTTQYNSTMLDNQFAATSAPILVVNSLWFVSILILLLVIVVIVLYKFTNF